MSTTYSPQYSPQNEVDYFKIKFTTRLGLKLGDKVKITVKCPYYNQIGIFTERIAADLYEIKLKAFAPKNGFVYLVFPRRHFEKARLTNYND